MVMGRLSRAVVVAQRWMVAMGHPLAYAAGLRVLTAGGNAVDAAVATAGVMGVAQPMMSGLGSDTFMLVYRAAERKLYAVNGSGVAPYAATVGWFAAHGHRTMPLRGMLAVSVPGAVDAMVTALERWGSGRFTLEQLLEAAIGYADEGVPIAPKVAFWVQQAADVIAQFPSTAKVFMPRGVLLRAGDVVVMKDLARSLRAVAAGGREVFYRGDLAKQLAAYIQAHGGLLTEREFAEHRSEVYEPIATTYRGHTVCTTAPPSQGVIVLEMLNIMEGYSPEQLRWGTADAVHLIAEAKKLAFADRLAYLGDPRFIDNPLDTLLSKDYAARRRSALDPRHAQAEVPAGALAETKGGTTELFVAPAHGELVAYITRPLGRFRDGEISARERS